MITEDDSVRMKL